MHVAYLSVMQAGRVLARGQTVSHCDTWLKDAPPLSPSELLIDLTTDFYEALVDIDPRASSTGRTHACSAR